MVKYAYQKSHINNNPHFNNNCGKIKGANMKPMEILFIAVVSLIMFFLLMLKMPVKSTENSQVGNIRIESRTTLEKLRTDVVSYNMVVSDTTKSHLQRAKSLLRSGVCKHVYLDVGTNVGIQIRKLYEPQYYPEAKILPVFDKFFGNDMLERSRVCAFGVEPNPNWSSRLKQIDTAYNKHGWPVVIFTETAAGVNGKNISFFLQPKLTPEVHQWGAATIRYQESMQEVTVGTLPLSEFIHEISNRPGTTSDSKIIMKFDTEGGEFEILPHLLMTNALCQIDKITCEFHPTHVKDPPKDISSFLYNINYILKKGQNCRTQIEDQDDETYGVGEDKNPLPQ